MEPILSIENLRVEYRPAGSRGDSKVAVKNLTYVLDQIRRYRRYAGSSAWVPDRDISIKTEGQRDGDADDEGVLGPG